MRKLIILGAGGYAEQLAFVVARGGRREVVGFVDDTANAPAALCGLPVRKSPDAFDLAKADIDLICAVGSIPTRRRWYETYARDYPFTTVVDPSVIMAPDVQIGKNVVILGNTVCSAACTIDSRQL